MKTIKKMMNSKPALGLGVMLLVCVTVAFAAVNVKGLIVDAHTGFTQNGAAPANHTLCGNGTVYVDAATCGAGTPRTCNANGCYRIGNDGTIEQWGTSSTGASGGATQLSVTFPVAFTNAASISVTANCMFDSNCATNIFAAPTTSAFIVQFNPFTFVGGTGANLSGSEVALWYAVGY